MKYLNINIEEYEWHLAYNDIESGRKKEMILIGESYWRNEESHLSMSQYSIINVKSDNVCNISKAMKKWLMKISINDDNLLA